MADVEKGAKAYAEVVRTKEPTFLEALGFNSISGLREYVVEKIR